MSAIQVKEMGRIVCDHETWAAEAAVVTDGLCPLCLQEEIQSLRDENQRAQRDMHRLFVAAQPLIEFAKAHKCEGGGRALFDWDGLRGDIGALQTKDTQ